MPVDPGGLGLPLLLDGAEELPAVPLVEAGVVGEQVEGRYPLGSQLGTGQAEQLPGKPPAPQSGSV